jgi:hypothetical protein
LKILRVCNNATAADPWHIVLAGFYKKARGTNHFKAKAGSGNSMHRLSF